ncbi:MAG: 2TM domain-containing protein [Flavobacteriaceae bacterium]|jgi:hypothetical protein
MESKDEIKYQEAVKRVKKIKGFYSHLSIYIVLNILIFALNAQSVNEGESYFQWKTLSTPFFWGIGLVAHGLSVFLPSMILGNDWEERKIKEIMDKENSKWE